MIATGHTTPGAPRDRRVGDEPSSPKLAECVIDPAVEGGVGVDHLLQPADRRLFVDGQGEHRQHFVTVWSGRCRTDQNAAVGVGDQSRRTANTDCRSRPQWRSLIRPSLPAWWIQPRADSAGGTA